MAKKLLAVLFIIISLLVVNTNVSFAQTNNSNRSNPWNPAADANSFNNYRDAIESDNCMSPSLECLVHQVFKFASLEFVNSTLYTEFRPDFSSSENQQSGTLYGIGKLIGLMYENKVANTQTYVAYLLESAHVTPKAYAQGLGFSSLNPILELWKAFRNIAYMFFVILFIVIGFMIMFRQKIGGQAAITAQRAIPSIIVSLILVTFSYAIAGLLIDLMYVVMFLIIGIFGQTLPSGSDNLIDMSILQVAGAMFRAGVNPAQNKDLVSNLFGSLDVNETINSFLSIAGGLTLTVVLAVAILIGTIKLFFELLRSYANVVLSVVTSPLILMMGAIPGKNPVVGWLKNLVGNLLPFPVVLLVLVIFYQFSNLSGSGSEGGFIPPFLIARGQAGAISSLMGLALILALPEIVKSSKKGLVTEGGFGAMIFNAAGESLKEGWKGGKIPGTGIKIPGARQMAETPLFGTAKSRKSYDEKGGTVLKKGLIGGAYEKTAPYRKIAGGLAVEYARNLRKNRTTPPTQTNTQSNSSSQNSRGSYNPPE